MLIEFRPSPIHGTGGFTGERVAAGARLLEYVGERITKSESVRRCQSGNTFIFALDNQYDLDGNVDWNPAKWLNHSCAPNCAAELIEGRIWIVAQRDMESGEEITLDYGYDLESYREYPCHCGAVGCAGYIVASELRRYVWSGPTRMERMA